MTVQDGLTTTEMTETGDVPDWKTARSPTLGPAGLLTIDDAGSTRFGVPIAG